MDKFIEFIDDRVKKQISNTNFLKSIPCRVLRIVDDNYVEVETVANHTKYIIPNFSGSNVNIGENVQVFYKGKILSQNSSYIGASPTKSEVNRKLESVEGSKILGEVFEKERAISSIDFTAVTDILLFGLNIVVFGSSNGLLDIIIYIDGTAYGFTPKITLTQGNYISQSFTFPLNVGYGEHQIEIKAKGIGNVTDIHSYIMGHGVEFNLVYEPTSEEDYIYINDTQEANALYYIGEDKNLEIPTTLNDVNIKTLQSTSFNISDVTNVYIPEGIQEIE